MPVIDQFSDPAFGTLHRQVSRMPALEAFVKQAEVEQADVAALPDTAFAWPSERKFPVHTPEHAALSYAYSKVASVLPAEVRSNIVKALEAYDVPEATFAEQAVKEASYDNDYLVPEHRLFLVQTVTQCKLAQDRLVEALPKLDLEHRAIACANLVKKADAMGVELRPEILQLAGLVVSSTKIAMEWLEARANRLPADDTVHKLAYLSLAKGLVKQPEDQRRKPSAAACEFSEFLQDEHVCFLWAVGSVFKRLAHLVDQNQQPDVLTTDHMCQVVHAIHYFAAIKGFPPSCAP